VKDNYPPPQGWVKKKKDIPHRRGGGYIKGKEFGCGGHISKLLSGVMAKTVGYMLTWTTYGSWLPGDKRRYVQHGKVLDGNEKVREHARRIQKSATVRLTKKERSAVEQAITAEIEKVGQQLEAIAVCSNHVHLVVRWSYHPVDEIVSRYKNAGMFALRDVGRTGRIWTKGYDRRFCFTEEEFNRRIEYVKRHKD
jgi:hypothetical protein